jgi:hypothetical protein
MRRVLSMQIALFSTLACYAGVSGCVRQPEETRFDAAFKRLQETNALLEEANARRDLCAKQGVLKIGMKQSQVVSTCWGNPRDTVEVTTAQGKSEGWLYGEGHNLYFINGVLVKIEAMH